MSSDGDIAKLMGSFAKLVISAPLPPVLHRGRRSFLDLPTELHYMIYQCFTPEDQTAAYPDEPAYDGLLRTRKQIRKEAQKEIQKAADKYYRAYETGWLREVGFGIKIEPIIDPSKVTVLLSASHLPPYRPSDDHPYVLRRSPSVS